jgi:hypothetical protein
MAADSAETLRRVNRKLEAVITRLHPENAAVVSIRAAELAALRTDLAAVGRFLRDSALDTPNQPEEINIFFGRLAVLARLLPSLAIRLEAERRRLESDRQRLQATSAWADGSRRIL